MRTTSCIGMGAITVAALLLTAVASRAQQTDPAIQIGDTDLGGVVTGPNGPEAGVWVIAETTDLPTKFAKVVVTDDRGRYVIPELPDARYRVWVRGYGLVDSPKVESSPGKLLNLTAVEAPSAAAAAEYYPGVYWYSMLKIPDESQFPGTGQKGNGISEAMRTQHYWIDTIKNSCQSCHGLGTHGVRIVPQQIAKESKDSAEAWARRIPAARKTGLVAFVNRTPVTGQIGAARMVEMSI